MFARKTPPRSNSRFSLRRLEPVEDALDRDHLERVRDEYDRGELETVSLDELRAKLDD